MIISEQWLRDWVRVELSAQEIADCLTNAGLEVDGVQAVAGEIENVVVGQVDSVTKHPDADRLKVTKVNIGTDQLDIVCGASNVREGLIVAVATVGARLPNGLKIKRAKVRGVESNGMLCSAAELGLEEDSAGLIELDNDAEIGQRVDEYLQLDDQLIDIDLTPNRGDCLSVQGIARELKVLADAEYHPLDITAVEADSDATIDVELEDSNSCPSYAARVISGVSQDCRTPLWMSERLRRSGLRPISPIVDITNYVMLELGQPMHAFDRAKIDGKIIVRQSSAGEQITLLDDSKATLDGETLVIADAKGPIAIAGVMGGADSAIDDHSKDIVLEAAHFTRRASAGKARRYGLHTESSHRFERGVDPQLPLIAMERATELVLEICGGSAGQIVHESNSQGLLAKPAVSIRLNRLKSLLGMELDRDQVAGILNRVAESVSGDDNEWSVTPPSYRFDIEREADLVEEVARVTGYDNIPTAMPRIAPRSVAASERKIGLRQVRQSFVARDYREAITYSFIDPAAQKLFSNESPVKLANPLADNLAVMRTSLIPGLMAALQFNKNRQHDRIRLFEVGATYHHADNGYRETQRISGVAVGLQAPTQWGVGKSQNIDFYDIKADLEAVLALTGHKNPIIFNEFEHIAMHPGQLAVIERRVFDPSSLAEGPKASAEGSKVRAEGSQPSAEGSQPSAEGSQPSAEGSKVRAEGSQPYAEGSQPRAEGSDNRLIEIGWLGRLHPSLEKHYGVSNVYAFELNLEAALEAELPVFESVSRFPSIKRDVSVVVDHNVPVSSMIEAVRNKLGSAVNKVDVFDVYRGQILTDETKSVSLSLVLQHPDKTMTDEEAENLVGVALTVLAEQFGAQLRS